MTVESTRALEAFVNFCETFDISNSAASVGDLSSGLALYDVLAVVDAQYFSAGLSPAVDPVDGWVERLTALKRIYRQLMQYYGDVLQQPTAQLDVPDLQAMAKDQSMQDTLTFCKLAIAAAVQSERKKEIVEHIQKLSENDQHHLMRAIEQVMSKLNQSDGAPSRRDSMSQDDHYYELQAERRRIFSEKESIQHKYEQLLQEHQTIQGHLEDMTAEKEDAVSRLRGLNNQLDDRRQDRADTAMRSEIDRLRLDIQKIEESLATAETELERQIGRNRELEQNVEELQGKADEAVRLKDQVDEYRHAAEKLQKTENVMEKYKKKLEESADLRRRIRSLEEQNATVVDKNASLEEENRKYATYKPLVDSYRSQLSELETRAASRSKEAESLRFELDQTKTRLRVEAEERSKDAEALQLYQERVRELELSAPKTPRLAESKAEDALLGNMTDMTEAELLGDKDRGLGGELENALSGTTMTDLKIQIRKLQRDLEAARSNQAEASRLLVLENLLEDANRMKSRYEQDHLTAHREQLLLQSKLDEIRSGKALGDGAEAAIALRQRLNETVESLDALKKEHTELLVQYENQTSALTIAKSDLNLVNKDQLDILASLRESVNEDKTGLQTENNRLRDTVKEMKDKVQMQLEQINTLLVEKVGLQSEGIGQREKLLERERNFSDLRASLSGRELPEDVKSRLLSMHEDNIQLKEQMRTLNEKLVKARELVKTQDQMIKDANSKALTSSLTQSSAMSEQAETQHRTQLRIVEDENKRLKTLQEESAKHFQKEQQKLLDLIHKSGLKNIRNRLDTQQPNSWLRQQRVTLNQSVVSTPMRKLPILSVGFIVVAPLITFVRPVVSDIHFATVLGPAQTDAVRPDVISR